MLRRKGTRMVEYFNQQPIHHRTIASEKTQQRAEGGKQFEHQYVEQHVL